MHNVLFNQGTAANVCVGREEIIARHTSRYADILFVLVHPQNEHGNHPVNLSKFNLYLEYVILGLCCVCLAIVHPCTQ